MTHWIVIADASDARIFSMKALNKPLELVREFGNPDGRLRTQELVSDTEGRVGKNASPGTRSAMSPRTSAHDDAANHFAHELAQFLRQELERKAFTSLSLAAPPHFLGMIRPMLGKELDQHLKSTLARDLVHVPKDELRGHIESLLGPGVFG